MSELAGVKRLLALAEALANSNFTQLTSNFVTGKYVPQISKFQALELVTDKNDGTFSRSIYSTLPFRPVTPYDGFVDAEILHTYNPTLTGAVLEENVSGKSWSTFYWVNQTGQITTLKFDPCDYWCIVTCAFTHPEIWAQCTVFCVCAFAFPPLCLAPCAICIIALGAVAAICTIPCCPSTVTLRVESTPVHDGWLRYHGLTVNEVLRSDFETTQQDKIFITTASYFSYQKSISVHSGDNYVMEAPGSSWPNYYWNTKIYINGNLVGQGDVGYNHILTVHFTV